MVNLKRLQDLHDRATPVGWDTVPTSSGGVLLKRGKEYPLAERHPQTHLQVVPSVDGELMAEVRNALPELLDAVREVRNLRAQLAALIEPPSMKGLDDPNATVLVFTGHETDAELDAVEQVLEHELGARESVVLDKP